MQLLTIAMAVATATAIPTHPAHPAPKRVEYVDKFDDLAASAVGVGAASMVGTYNALNYAGFSVGKAGTLPTQKQPPSAPNFIYGGLTSTIQLQFLPANSCVEYFDLHSPFFSCAAPGGAGLSESCTIQLAGRKAPCFGGHTDVYELVANPALLAGTYNYTSLSDDFCGLDEVSIAVISSGLPALPQFDNVAYTATFQ